MIGYQNDAGVVINPIFLQIVKPASQLEHRRHIDLIVGVLICGADLHGSAVQREAVGVYGVKFSVVNNRGGHILRLLQQRGFMSGFIVHDQQMVASVLGNAGDVR